MNAGDEPIGFTLPKLGEGGWQALVDTAGAAAQEDDVSWPAGDSYTINARSLA